jgi:hypothetical protein
MSILHKVLVFRPSRRILVMALLLVGFLLAFMVYQRVIVAPTREHVIRRYDEFRAVVPTGNTEHMMAFVDPEFRDWAESRLHLYQTFARPLNGRSRVSVSSGEATIRPRPQTHFLIIPGGHSVKMVEREGEWFMGRVHID